MAGPLQPTDATTAGFLRRVGRPLAVLADPSAATLARPPEGAEGLRLRTLAGDVRQHTLDHLDGYLDHLGAAVEGRGGTVHYAADAAAARARVSALAGPDPRVIGSAVCDEVGLATSAAAVAAAAVVVVAAAAFVVAETGQVCLASDDPAVAAAAAAGVLVCVAGIEAVVPRTADLAVMLKLLARSATGRPMSAYTALLDPAAAGRVRHLVLVDNGRTELLAGEHRPVLRCIGCGACTAACPVYRSADVRPAGLWAGPVGAIVRPVARPPLDGGGAAGLPHASTLCGACAAACPVRVDLPSHLIALRGRSPARTVRLRLWAWIVLSPRRYRWATRWRRRRHPGRGSVWPTGPRRSFHDLWRDR